MRIYVTRARIEAARYWQECGIRMCEWCPIALAVRAKIGGRQTVSVDRHYLYLGKWKYPISERAREFISAFDRGHDVKPCVLEVGP